MLSTIFRKSTIKTITLPEIGEIKIQKRKQSKTIRITVKPPGIVLVSIPAKADFRQGENFLKEKQSWILVQLEKVRYFTPKNEIISNDIDFITQKRSLKLNYYTKSCFRCTISDDFINIDIPECLQVEEQRTQQFIKKAIVKALKLEAQEYLPRRLEELSQKTGLKYKEMTLMTSKRNWGLCLHNDVIKLNVNLIRLPKELIDYVIFHELAHIKEKNHSDRFYDFLGLLLPEHKSTRKQLKRYSPARLLSLQD